MSKEVALSFFRAVDQSPDLQKQVKPLDKTETPEEINRFIEIADKAGYHFTKEDLKEAVRARAERWVQSGELSEKELEEVAGGRFCVITNACVCTGCCWTS